MTEAAIERALRDVGARADDSIDLADTALLLGALDVPNARLARYRAHIGRLTGGVAARSGADEPLERRRGHLNAVLFKDNGYAGDTESYDDPGNANLLRVIDRRAGLPVSLGILYIHVARTQGWAVDGLAFPGHFLVRLDDRDRRLIVDPFHRGQTLEAGHLRGLLKQFRGADAELEPSHYAPVGNRAILLRLQNNIKTRALQAGDAGRAAAILERMLLIAPEAGGVWHELGILRARLGTMKDAVRALERGLACGLPDTARAHAEAALAKLKTGLH